MSLFSAALQLIPVAGALLSTFKFIQTGCKIAVMTSEHLEKLSKGLEAAKKVQEVVKTVGVEAPEAVKKMKESHGGTEAKERGDFQAEEINELSKLSIDVFAKTRPLEDQIVAKLMALRDAPGTVNMTAMVKQDLGEIPDGNLEDAMLQAQNAFEISLYKRYYLDSGRAYMAILQWGGDREDTWKLEGMPDGVYDRLWHLGMTGGMSGMTAWQIIGSIPHKEIPLTAAAGVEKMLNDAKRKEELEEASEKLKKQL
jgi:hypothetical protein